MYDQLFKIIPDLYTFHLMLSCFGIEKIKHGSYYSLSGDHIVNNFKNIKNHLETKYRKNKINKLYDNLNIKKCITMTKQVSIVHDYKIIKIKNIYQFLNLKQLRDKNKVMVSFD
jgi:hypothetical protein